MPSTIPYSLAFVGIILTASLAVLGQAPAVDDPCFTKVTCESCVVTKTNITVGPEGGNNGTCIFEVTRTGMKCVEKISPSEETVNIIYKIEGCANIPTPAPTNTTTTTPPPSTTTVPTKPTPTTPTPAPTPSTNSTTTVAPTTPAPNSTTTAPPTPTTPPSNSTTTAAPSNSTTTAAPSPSPRKGGFAWGEFIGGIVFAVAISSLAYLIWRFYKARLDRNYHTFANPTF